MTIDEERGRIVATTVDMMKTAEDVITELRKEDGQQFSSEKPSLLEMVAVSQLLVNMRGAGMFNERKPDDWEPPPGVITAVLKRLDPLIEGKVTLAVSRMTPLRPRVPLSLPPVPPPPAPGLETGEGRDA